MVVTTTSSVAIAMARNTQIVGTKDNAAQLLDATTGNATGMKSSSFRLHVQP